MKYYNFNRNGLFCGVTSFKTIKSTEEEPILGYRDKAYWTGNKWRYKRFHKKVPDFYPFDFVGKDIGDVPTIRFTNSIANNIRFLNGEEDRTFSGEVTILIPCYKKSKYIVRTVESCLNQTVPVKIIVLVMDQDSWKMVTDFLSDKPNVMLINHPRLNVIEARNKLVSMCPTDWFVFLDADDLLDPDFVEVLSKKKGAIRYATVKTDRNNNVYQTIVSANKNNIINIIYYNNTCLMHKDVFFDIGYDKSLFKGAEDIDFNIRLLAKKKWKITYTTDTAMFYRIDSENQLTKNYKKFSDSAFKMFKKNIKIFKEGVRETGENDNFASAIRFLLDDFCYTQFFGFLDMCNEVNLKLRFDHLCTQYFYKCLYQSWSLNKGKEVFEIPISVNSFDDILFLNKKFGDIFKILKNKYCIITSNKVCRRQKMSDDKFLAVANETKLPDKLFDYIRMWNYKKEFSEKCNINAAKEKVRGVNFIFSTKCNANCDYCWQEKNRKETSEEEMYNNFDKFLTKIESLGETIVPGILGGEPTLFSDELTKKILNRLKNYKKVIVFTNHIKKDSLWYEAENVVLVTHIINWIGRKNIKQESGNNYIIVVKKNEIENIPQFLKDNPELRVDFSPCSSTNKEFNCDEKDIRKIEELNYRYDGNILTEKNKLKLQSDCRKTHCTQEFDTITNEIRICCQGSTRVAIGDFNPDQREHKCGDCLGFRY